MPQVGGQPSEVVAVLSGLQLGNFMRSLALPGTATHWLLTGIQTRMIKIGRRLVRHA